MEHGSTGHAAHEPCLECEVPELARNHYFTGKLLTECDLTREQRYHLGKQRRHNQRLHGWGVACGLRVVAHETEPCQSRYVRIEPGTAIDCCGREITTQRIESFDFLRAAEEAFERSGREGSLGDAAHRLQICVRYVECPTEEVPVLFDECADGVECQPNCILDGYAFDVMLDAEIERDDPHGPRLVWEHTINVAHAKRVALDEPGARLYLLTADDPGRLFVLDAATDAVLTAYTLPAAADDIALAPDGAFLYAALPSDGVVVVLDAAKLATGAAAVRDLPVGDAGPDLRLAVSPADGRVFVLNPSAAEVTSWDASVTGPGRTPPAGRIAVGDGAAGMAVSPSGRWLVVPNAGAGTVTVADAQSLAIAPAIELGATAAPTAVALAETTAGIRVYVADANDLSVRALGFAPADSEPYPPLGEPQTLAHPPLELHASTGGRWLYALERDGDEGVLQVVDAFALQTGRAGAAGAQARMGQIPSGALLAPAARRLYVAFTGSDTSPGAVALVDVLEERCEELLERAGEPCPSCHGDDCVVLATVERYRVGERLTDARIDNRRGRRLLASTALLTEVVECILEHGVGEGERGPQGPPGAPGGKGDQGEAGPGFTSASVEHAQTPAVTSNFPAPGNLHFRLPVVTGADATPGAAVAASYGANGVIHFTIPPGAPGSQGPGFTVATVDHGPNPTVTPNAPTQGNLDFKLPIVKSADAGPGPLVSATYDKPSGNIHFTFPWHKAVALTHICAISWPHGGALHVAQEPKDLFIAFDGLVVSDDIHDHSVRVLRQSDDGCWCQIDGQLDPWMFEETCMIAEGERSAPEANGIRFQLGAGSFELGHYRVIVDGDFIRDLNKNGVDADHLPPWFGFGLNKSGDGIEGGTFESWFEVRL